MRSVRMVCLMLLPLAAGCSHYEFDLIEPPQLARHVGEHYTTVVLDPMRYHMRAYDGRLIVRIENPTDDAIELVGGRSYLIDPEGQSHPIPGQYIPPHAYIRRVFPPKRPVYYLPRPRIHYGFGYGWGWGYYRPYYPYGWWYDPAWDYPERYTYIDPSDPIYFGWNDEGVARFHFSYERDKKRFDQELVIKRVKVKN